MSPEDYVQTMIESPLGERTARARARLLVSGATAAVVVHTGLFPSQIDGLGITFTTAQRSAFLVILAVAICYFLVSFTLSAVTEFYAAKLRLKAHVESQLRDPGFLRGSLSEIRVRLKEIMHPLEVSQSVVSRIQAYRVLIDIYVPLAVGLYGLGVLLWGILVNEI